MENKEIEKKEVREINKKTGKPKLTPEELQALRLKNLKMWKPGEVTNPTGRPKGSKNKSTIARKWLEVEETALNELTGLEEKLTQEDLITLAVIKRAKKGDVKAYKELMNSAFGEEKSINHSGNVGLAHITGIEVI